MKKEYPTIKHQYDVWHYVKSITKKLAKIAKKKESDCLAEWIPLIANHIWWCAASSMGNTALLKDKYLSLLHHIVNKHAWSCMAILKSCEHKPLTRHEQRTKKWLKPGSAAFLHLKKILEDKKRLTDLEKLSHFCHTGILENFHSMMTITCPKRCHFFYDGMNARSQLALIRQNYNLHREQARTKAGDMRWRIVFPKVKKQWVAKKIYTTSSNQYILDLMALVDEMFDKSSSLRALATLLYKKDKREMPRNIATAPCPGRDAVIKAHQSRFLH